MKINSIKVIDAGRKGIEVSMIDPTISKGKTVNDEKIIVRPTPIPNKIKSSIARVQIYYLTLTGYFLPEYAKFVDYETGGLDETVKAETDEEKTHYKNLVELLDKTRITSIKTEGKSQFIISGFIEIIGRRGCSVTTPLMKTNDEMHFDRFFDCLDTIESIFVDCKEHVVSSDVEMQDAKQFMLDFAENLKDDKREDMLDLINNSDENQLSEQMIEILEKKGCIVIPPVVNEEPAEEKEEKKDDDFGKQESSSNKKAKEVTMKVVADDTMPSISKTGTKDF